MPKVEFALHRIKETLHVLPMLASLTPDKTLQNLSTSIEAISLVLVVERQGNKLSVYYVSRALQVSEIKYPIIENLLLALIYAARRLQ